MNRITRLIALAAAAPLLASPALAATINVFVPGTADPWLAGQPDGTILVGGFPADDVAPANSPVLASVGLSMDAGSRLTVVATGSVDYGGCVSGTPEGDDGCGANMAASEFFGISGYVGPINALAGVFLDDNVPAGAAPAGLDFTTLASRSAPSTAPLLGQVFFVGDGLTGTGSGAVQQFVIPAGATRLFLGSIDGPGANYNNSGGFDVTVTDETCLHRSDVLGLQPHSPPRSSIYRATPTPDGLSLQSPAYRCPFAPGDLELDAYALTNGIPLVLYQVNRDVPTLVLSRSGTTIRFAF